MWEAKSQSPWKQNRPVSIILYPVSKQSFTTFCISTEIPDPGSDWFTGQLSLCLRILCSKIVKLFDAPKINMTIMLLISPTIMLDNFPIMLNKSPILLNKSPIMLLSHTYTTQVQKFPLKPSKQLLSLAKSSYFRQWWDDALYLAEPPFRLSRRLKKHNNIASNNSCLT